MKGKKTRSLRKAVRLYRRRQYTYVINLLEPQVFLFRDNAAYYHILGMSCLYTGDYAGAYSYLRRASDLDPHRVDTVLGIAVVLLRRRQIDVAIQTYLDLLDKEPRNRRARRALQWIRKLDQQEEVVDWFDDGRIAKILPRRGWFVPRMAILGLIVIVTVSGLYFFGPSIAGLFRNILSSRDLRDGSSVLEFGEEVSLIAAPDDTTAKEPDFVFTAREIDALLTEMIDAFNDSRDNYVRREINRVLLSNASERVKQQALLLEPYLQRPDFISMTDNFPYREVASKPALYEGVSVKWRGRIANRVVGEDAIRFDLLVGYDEGNVLDGIVPAHVPFAVLLDDGGSVELIGSVRPLLQQNGDFALEVSDIRQLSDRSGSDR